MEKWNWFFVSSMPIISLIIICFFIAAFCYFVIRFSLQISDKKRLENIIATKTREISESIKKLSIILDSSLDAIIGIDRDGIITFVNRTGCDLLGYDRDEIIGESEHEKFHYLHPDSSDYPQIDCPIFSVLTRGAIQMTTNHENLIHRDGHFIPVDWTAIPIFEKGRKFPVGGVIFIRRTKLQKQESRDVEIEAGREHGGGK